MSVIATKGDLAPGDTGVDSAGELQTFLFQQFSLDTSPQSALAAPPPLALGLSLKSFLPLAIHQPTEREGLRVRQQSHCWVYPKLRDTTKNPMSEN